MEPTLLSRLWLHRKKVAVFVGLVILSLWKGCA